MASKPLQTCGWSLAGGERMLPTVRWSADQTAVCGSPRRHAGLGPGDGAARAGERLQRAALGLGEALVGDPDDVVEDVVVRHDDRVARVVQPAAAVAELALVGAHERRAAGFQLAAQPLPRPGGIVGRGPLGGDAEVAAELALDVGGAALEVDRRQRRGGDAGVQGEGAGEAEDRALRQRLGAVGEAVVLEEVAQRPAGRVFGHAVAEVQHVHLQPHVHRP
jgi:hypothetical protein